MRLYKSLGQHFITSDKFIEKEIHILDPKGKVVLEIGAGDGRLTKAILRAGAEKIYAVEKDKRMVEILNKVFSSTPKVVILNSDIRKISIPEDTELIVGNIPYYLSSFIIFKFLLQNSNRIHKAVFILQKEFGERMVASPNSKNYGRLSVSTQIFFNVKICSYIPKYAFKPVPKVDSVLVELVPKKNIHIYKNTLNIIRKLFSHKNKKIRNILPNVSDEWADKRPRELSPSKILSFAKCYLSTHSSSQTKVV